MKIIVLGLSLSSSWGNGHATTYRALLRELGKRHDILFLEREQPWYAANRDLSSPDFCTLAFYRDRSELKAYRDEISAADAVILGSYLPEGRLIARELYDWVGGSFCFYDIDTPVTLSKLDTDAVNYIDSDAIPLFDIYFSFSGGPILKRLEAVYGAHLAVPLYCSVDEKNYRPLPGALRWDLGYIGTYSPDRQPALERLLLAPARLAPDKKFVVAGPMYPDDIVWPENVERIEHLAPDCHAEFYNGQTWTLNITRADMIAVGYSPSVRLFEAAACGVPVISDAWAGLETIFMPNREIIVARSTADVLAALELGETECKKISEAARTRCLAAHTASHRAVEMEAALASVPPARRMASTLLAGVRE
jgi:spore maturation protein CgeB